MIFIQKKPEPEGLQNYKAENQKNRTTSTWKEFSEAEEFKTAFDELRRSLVEEQHYICCYCQQKISFKHHETGKPLMKSEHFKPKGGKFAVPDKQLDYSNLLASCLGNTDTEQEKHCDSHKLSEILQAITNPSEGRRRNFRPFFKYDVRVKEQQVVILPLIENELLRKDIERILNLNEQSLRSKRFTEWQSVWRLISKKNGEMKIRRIEQILELYKPANQREYKPFCDFIASWLKEHLRQLQGG